MARYLRRLPLRDATHDMLEAFGIVSLALCVTITGMAVYGGVV